MTFRAKKIDRLLTVLDGPEPDRAALDETLTILAAHLRRQRRDGQGVLYLLRRDDRALVLGRDGSFVHEADPMGDTIAVIGGADGAGNVAVYEEHRDRSDDGAICIAPGSVRDENGRVGTDSGFRWPWSELGPALAAAVRAIPSPKPRPVLCQRCQKEFYR